MFLLYSSSRILLRPLHFALYLSFLFFFTYILLYTYSLFLRIVYPSSCMLLFSFMLFFAPLLLLSSSSSPFGKATSGFAKSLNSKEIFWFKSLILVGALLTLSEYRTMMKLKVILAFVYSVMSVVQS